MTTILLLIVFLCIDVVLLLTVLMETAPVSSSYSKHILKIIFLAVLGLLIFFAIVHFSKKENREPVRPVDPDEKMTAIDYVWIAVLLGITLGISYVADKYIYQPCRFPFAGNWAMHPELTVFAFLGLSFVTGILINRVQWFSHHIGWLVMVSMATVLIIISLLVRFMCYSF